MKKTNATIKKYIKYIFIGLVTGMTNGLFGSGGGTIVVPAMTLLLGVEEHRAHATAIAVILPLTVVSAFFYIANHFVNWELTWKTMLGGMAGGYAGAKLLNLCPTALLRKIFAVFMIFASFRMLIG
ncbi:MAG: sulfite exporter TauE/SafE family protein [Clostridiales bacterium]|nr:sulfite exporter TauE/SafE family protein [Eubacteriales bacterium]MDH7565534.1 sulfite exporter TauE/SafE family protein [Clostridiales bacterium]